MSDKKIEIDEHTNGTCLSDTQMLLGRNNKESWIQYHVDRIFSSCPSGCCDPQRFASAADARALMGTAPVTKSSGTVRVVQFRRGCWKFARCTLQLFAEQSRRQGKSPWS